MTDITDLWALTPSQSTILNNIILQFVKIEGLANCVKEYLIPQLIMVYDPITRDIKLSTPLTFTLYEWYVGSNCNTVDVKCIYPHPASEICGRFIHGYMSNLIPYQIGMRLLLDIVRMKFPDLPISKFTDNIDVLTKQDLSLSRMTVDNRVIMCTSLHISGPILHPSWILQ